MRLEDGENQLYISVMTSGLRKLQRAQQIPSFDSFYPGLKESAGFSSSQIKTLNYRVISSMISFMKVKKN